MADAIPSINNMANITPTSLSSIRYIYSRLSCEQIRTNQCCPHCVSDTLCKSSHNPSKKSTIVHFYRRESGSQEYKELESQVLTSLCLQSHHRRNPALETAGWLPGLLLTPAPWLGDCDAVPSTTALRLLKTPFLNV